MLRFLIVFPLVLMAAVAGMALLPLLVVFPLLLGLGTAVATVILGVAMLGLVFRLVAGLLIGVLGVAMGAAGLGLLFAGGAVALAISVLFAHLLGPLLVIFGLIWLIRRTSRPAAPLQITHNPT